MACESYIYQHLVGSVYFSIFLDFNVVTHLVVPAGWGFCLPRLSIYYKNVHVLRDDNIFAV